jgi:hypothetical protein
MLSASQISKAIRMKKKALMSKEPEIVDTSPVPDMNAQDVWNMEKDGYVEDKLGSPKKISASESALEEPGEDILESKRMQRMARLRSYLDGMSIDGK